MVTLVGMQAKFMDALKDLLELEYDAIETYTAAIDRLDNENYREKLSAFRSDHEYHIEEIKRLLKSSGEEAISGPSGKQILMISRVAIGNLIGDNAILKAMLSAEEDTNSAYERMLHHKDKPDYADDFLSNAREDERRHKKWLEHVIA